MSRDAQAKKGLVLLILFRLFRILRVFRILKLSRYSDGLEILWQTMKSAKQELGVLLLFIAIGMTLFSASIYYVELGYQDSDFPSIPDTFWFTIITWTSVGYGDMVPKHPVGKLVGGICSATGVLCLAFIVPVVVNHFEYFFHRKSNKLSIMSCHDLLLCFFSNFALNIFHCVLTYRWKRVEETPDCFGRCHSSSQYLPRTNK